MVYKENKGVVFLGLNSGRIFGSIGILYRVFEVFVNSFCMVFGEINKRKVVYLM